MYKITYQIDAAVHIFLFFKKQKTKKNIKWYQDCLSELQLFLV